MYRWRHTYNVHVQIFIKSAGRWKHTITGTEYALHNFCSSILSASVDLYTNERVHYDQCRQSLTADVDQSIINQLINQSMHDDIKRVNRMTDRFSSSAWGVGTRAALIRRLRRRRSGSVTRPLVCNPSLVTVSSALWPFLQNTSRRADRLPHSAHTFLHRRSPLFFVCVIYAYFTFVYIVLA